jgi:SAM-dependent methyltransferase
MSEQATSSAPNGQQLKPDADFGRFYYRHDCGVPYERNDHWLEFFGRIADAIVRDLRPTTVLDAGCAMGFLVEALRKRGVEARGIDVSEYAISQVDASVRDHCSVGSLTDPIEGRYDLVVCIEVLEHIAPAEAGKAVANICAAGDRLLLSTTPDDFGEATHLNVQPPEAWAATLAGEGFFREVERDVSYVTPWAALYACGGEPTEEVVRRYDRSWHRLRREADQLRDSLLAAEQRLGELEDRPEGTRPELLAELDRRQEEILRLRDLLIGKDAELGATKGRLALFEDRTQRIAGAKQQIASRFPFLRRLVGPILRLIRR